MQCFCGSRGCWNHGQRGTSCTPKIFVRKIQELLIIRIRVYRGHKPMLDAEVLQQDFGDGGEAIRRA